jgi:hypothetical protein
MYTQSEKKQDYWARFAVNSCGIPWPPFGLSCEFDLVAAHGAGVIEDDFTAAAHLLLFELDGVAADRSLFDRNCSAASAFNASAEFAAGFGFQCDCHHLSSAPALDFGRPLSVNFSLGQSEARNREHANQ